MPYLVICACGEGADALRRRERARHIQFVLDHRQRIIYGGAVTDERAGMTGMLLILDFDCRALAEAFLSEEPYCRSGMFRRIEIERFEQRLPELVDGYLAQQLQLERRLEAEQFHMRNI